MVFRWLAVQCAVLFCLGIPTSAFAQDVLSKHPLQNQILDHKGQVVSHDALLAKIGSHAYVFVGEKHDNPKHHEIELAIIRMRLSANFSSNPGRIVFEMLNDSQDALIAKLQPEQSLVEMRQTLEWPSKGWDWDSYGPQFHAAAQARALYSGNISRSMISAIYKGGTKVLAETPKLSSATKQSMAVHNHLLDQIFASHCGMQSRESLQPMLHIQLAKDASMASAMMGAPRALLVAGGEHVRAATGAPMHLKTILPQADPLVIQLVEVKPGKTTLDDYLPTVGAADLYWFTEATPEQDYCAGVKGRAAQ